MKKTIGLVMASCMVLTMAVGCGGKDGTGTGGTSVKKASTPKEAVELFVAAIQDGNKEQFVAIIEAPESQKGMVGPMFDATSGMIMLDKEMIAKYGKEAVDKVKNEKGGMKTSNDNLADTFKNVDIKEEGDKATATPKSAKPGAEPMELVKVDGQWKIKLPGPKGSADPAEQERMTKMVKGMGEIFTKARAKVGKEGYDPKKINDEMGADMMALLFSSMPKPPVSSMPKPTE